MPPFLVIARLTIQEASRRRLLLALLILTLVVVGFSAWGFNKITTLTRSNGEPLPPDQIALLTSQLLIVITFMFSGVLALSAAVVAGPLISSEVESGLLLSILARPVRRSEIVIGKWLGLAALVALYAAFAGTLELGAVDWATGYLPPHPVELLAFVAAEGLVLLSVGLVLSTRLSGITAGVIALVSWLIAWIAGVVGDIGAGLENQALANVGVVSHLVLPSDGLWRGAIYAMEPDTLIAAMRALGTAGRANPFAATDPPPMEFLGWVVVWFALAEDRVRLRRARSVRPFDGQLRLRVARVSRRQLVADGGGHEQVALQRQQRLVANLLRAREALQRLLPRAVLEHPLDRKAERVVDPAVVLGHGDDRASRLLQELGADAAHVAEALDRGPGLVRRSPQVLERRHGADRDPAPGRLDATRRPTDLERLARHRGRHRVAEVHRQRVHDPRHRLPVGVHVRRRDVAVAPDQDRDLGREAPRHVLQLVLRELARVDDDAALGAAERDADDSALPRHPHRERLDLVQRHVGVVADATLGRPAVDVVLDTVPREDPRMPVIELDGEVARELALHLAQDLTQPRLELDDLGRLVELRLRGAPFVGFYDRLQISTTHFGL